ncbi:GNAT family N-acetyltransferase [Portibacter lacus]|uniref:N-acetyltransferase domain-containing protein n=1 Tax=Portibacter lacus TaxID=1099794 RepID=A0AA37WCN1_9BACT|nr:GNAT family N-acetyltransferase [Portibacter lacus]GLR16691.1 hypothetical protein GCM10007940_13060 [Portibacter lacus]
MKIVIHKKAKVNTSELLEKFSPFIIPSVQKKGAKSLPAKLDIAFATIDNKMIGLAILMANEHRTIGKLTSLVVSPDYRGKGVAQNLLAALTDLSKENGIKEIKTNYRSHWKYSPQISHLLQKANWSTPTVEFVIVDGLAANVLQLFKTDESPYPDGFTTVPWSDLSEDDLFQLKEKVSIENIPSDQNPFIAEKSINEKTSLILKFEGEIIGWVISHILSSETNEFTAYYINEKHRSFRLAHKLMRETIFRQHELTNLKKFIIVAKKSNNLMSSFLLRHAEKTEVKLIQTLYSQIILKL